MNVVFNGKIAPYESISVDIEDRSFLYGDGLFETMFCENREVRLLEYHLQRLRDGCHSLGLQIPKDLTEQNIINWSTTVAPKAGQPYRLKLIIWRLKGGLYTPESNECSFLLQAKQMDATHGKTRKNVVTCNRIVNCKTSISAFKTISSLKYVVAGMEMREKKGDEIIILDHDNNVSEGLYSNIFWRKGESFYTPRSETGCIEGTMRRYLITKNKDNPINQVTEPLDTLLAAEQVFFTNSLGVFPVERILNTEYPDLAIPKQLLPP